MHNVSFICRSLCCRALWVLDVYLNLEKKINWTKPWKENKKHPNSY